MKTKKTTFINIGLSLLLITLAFLTRPLSAKDTINDISNQELTIEPEIYFKSETLKPHQINPQSGE